MQNLKNKKRVTSLAVAFMLIFLTGTAFAVAQGTLDIVGTVNVGPIDLLVTWDEDYLAFEEGFTTQVVSIVDVNGRPRQRIEWTVNFGESATNAGSLSQPFNIDFDDLEDMDHYAVLMIGAQNESTTDVLITGATIDWQSSSLTPAALGLDADFVEGSLANFVGPLSAGASTSLLNVAITWDPATMTQVGEGPFQATFIIEFDYEMAP
ncbi:MAG: hypothetical protein FWE02_04265 [Defluviitaleaceae bacterium]|nr:hypothetical protein [Defluviitaleaceae bacterium]